MIKDVWFEGIQESNIYQVVCVLIYYFCQQAANQER
jgi:hypothetical protein